MSDMIRSKELDHTGESAETRNAALVTALCALFARCSLPHSSGRIITVRVAVDLSFAIARTETVAMERVAGASALFEKSFRLRWRKQ
jgi:hypothetical protein